MKKHLLLSFTIIALILNSGAEVIKKNMSPTVNPLTRIHLITETPDTIKYLRDNFITQKDMFQHKELNMILNSSHLAVKSYCPIKSFIEILAPVTGIYLNFENANAVADKLRRGLRAPILIVYFEQPVSQKKALVLYTQSFGEWLEADKDFYGQLIVKDISMLRTN